MLNELKKNLEARFQLNSLRKVIQEEGIYSAKIANRFRYIFLLFIIINSILNLSGIKDQNQQELGIYIYTIGIGAYLFMTILHTLILKNNNRAFNDFFGYINVIIDFVIITLMLLAWYRIESPSNFNFFLKNPSFYYYLLPFFLSMIQLRFKYVFFCFICFILIHYLGLVYGFSINQVPLADTWHDYVLGGKLFYSDYIASRPLIFFIVTISISYSIYRTIFMLRKISIIEAEKSSLSRYFSPDIIEEITKTGLELKKGKKQEVTILFQDIRDFTRFSEKLSAEELVEFLNEFREIMTKIVFKHKGTLDKYIGDAIMATFGTPTPSSLDTENAVKASIEMIQELNTWNQQRINSQKQAIKIGIGIHKGEVFTGNIGFEGKMEYTVIGDAVNTASRIESLCKTFQAELLISEEVKSKIQIYNWEAMPPVEVKGKEKPIQVYKFLGID
jgi:adenylate cyclase